MVTPLYNSECEPSATCSDPDVSHHSTRRRDGLGIPARFRRRPRSAPSPQDGYRPTPRLRSDSERGNSKNAAYTLRAIFLSRNRRGPTTGELVSATSAWPDVFFVKLTRCPIVVKRQLSDKSDAARPGPAPGAVGARRAAGIGGSAVPSQRRAARALGRRGRRRPRRGPWAAARGLLSADSLSIIVYPSSPWAGVSD